MILVFSILGLALAFVPAAMFLRNIGSYSCEMPAQNDHANPKISVLIPARDEETGIKATVNAALRSQGVEIEVCVLDDHSSDRTAEFVQSLSEQDHRVRYIESDTLPIGWNGKQHACWQLSHVANNSRLVFMDADVRLKPDALSRMSCRYDQTDVALLSAFPHQETGTWLERWIIPMMHFILLGFLPIDRMRVSKAPAYAAGCGQLFMTDKDVYDQAGTHQAIRQSRHDGLKLPRAYRIAGLSTDVVDGTDLADCRMYRNAREVIRGVLKNADEGIANPRLILPFTIFLLGSSVLPVMTLTIALAYKDTLAILFSVLSLLLGHLPRLFSAIYFRQPLDGVLFHSIATLAFTLLQWTALVGRMLGRQVKWRGRI